MMPTPTPTSKLHNAVDKRHNAREREVVRFEDGMSRWVNALEARLLGVIAANRGGVEGVTGSIDVILLGADVDAAAEMEKGLLRTWEWSWRTAVNAWLTIMPTKKWAVRLMPIKAMYGTESYMEGQPNLDAEVELQRILDGEVSDEEARKIVREIEFPPPPPEKVQQILDATNAPDGLSAMERIKTVAQRDLQALRSVIVSGVSTGMNLDKLTKGVKAITDLIHWKARRIARTEGMRIAEAGLKETWMEVDDLIRGIQTFNSQDANVRPEHRWWHDVIFYRTGRGEYLSRSGKTLPVFPAGPNCRCWSTPILVDF